ncbi:MAG: PEP-CTERM sorting domain-containing protein [Verrucomicrobiaceae bacterium]
MKLTSALLFLVLPAGSAFGQIFNIDLNTSQRGWVDDAGLSDANNGNYIAGSIGGTEYRNYFTFDLSGLVGTVQSATLTLDLPQNGFSSPTGSEAFGLSGASAISGNISNGASVFDDLGDGPLYGVSLIDSSSQGGTVSITLNSDFLAAANSGASTLTIGGSLLSLGNDPNISEYAFAFSDANQANTPVTLSMVVDVSGAAVPEPSSTILVGLAAGLGLIRRRR